eukprot:UN03159
MAEAKGISKPEVGDRFSVRGADKWKSENDMKEVVYRGEVETVKDNMSDGINMGTLVFARNFEGGCYVIKATETKFYYCIQKVDGDWRALGLFFDGLFFYDSSLKQPNMRVVKIDEEKSKIQIDLHSFSIPFQQPFSQNLLGSKITQPPLHFQSPLAASKGKPKLALLLTR